MGRRGGDVDSSVCRSLDLSPTVGTIMATKAKAVETGEVADRMADFIELDALDCKCSEFFALAVGDDRSDKAS